MDHIGMDVHKKESQICMLTDAGELIERRVHKPPRFAAVLGDRPRARILLEASTDSEWVARCLEALRLGDINGILRPLGTEGQPPN